MNLVRSQGRSFRNIMHRFQHTSTTQQAKYNVYLQKKTNRTWLILIVYIYSSLFTVYLFYPLKFFDLLCVINELDESEFSVFRGCCTVWCEKFRENILIHEFVSFHGIFRIHKFSDVPKPAQSLKSSFFVIRCFKTWSITM